MQTKRVQIAVYGGAFNPPHIGHAVVIIQASKMADTVVVAPSFAHPFGKRMAPFSVRCEMVSDMISRLHRKGVNAVLSSAERKIHEEQGEPVYSLSLLRELSRQYRVPGSKIGLVIGEDNIQHLSLFKNVADLLNEFQILIVKENEQIHSTVIRDKIAAGEDVSAYLVNSEMHELLSKTYNVTSDRGLTRAK